jgi:hypothetical protein
MTTMAGQSTGSDSRIRELLRRLRNLYGRNGKSGYLVLSKQMIYLRRYQKCLRKG